MYRLTETTHRANEHLSFHRHERAYIALPLEGAYEELSVDGRFLCKPGLAVIHAAWHAHADRFDDGGGRILNLSLPDAAIAPTRGSVTVRIDVVEMERLARRRPSDAAMEIVRLCQAAHRLAPASPGWLGFVLHRLRSAPEAKVSEIAAEVGISREHLARHLKNTLGLQPSRIRSEWRFRTAVELLVRGKPPGYVAAAAGYADQSHMTRDVKARAGKTPGSFNSQLA